MQALDLGPIKKLDNLKKLGFAETKVRSFEPLSNAKSLEALTLHDMEILDYESLKMLKKLKRIIYTGNINLTEKQIKELKEALPETNIDRLLISY